MRILFVIDGFEFGGGERVFLQLALRLKERHHVFVATHASGNFAHKLKMLGIEPFSVNMNRTLAFKPIRQIKDIISQYEIDLVHSQGARADFFARAAGGITKAPHVLCTVAMPVEGFDVGSLKKGIYRFMDHLLGHFVERFIVVSDSLKSTLVEGRGISDQRVVRIYNGIELDKYNPDMKKNSLRDQWDIPLAVPLVGAIGRMVWQKGFKYLIEAVPEILQSIPEARFLLVGEGPLRPNLENVARKLNVHERVIFTGFRSDIRELLCTIDILAVPSLLEGFPMITLEAMAMAKPIVATQIEGISEQILDGEEGILVPPRNPNAMAAAVLRLVQDKEFSSRLGAAARRKVESCFSVEKMVTETEKVYLYCLKPN
jgi:glycosyltransferase involved in cell wall biosynthesis